MSRRTGLRVCRHCSGPISDRGLIFCKPLCRDSAKLERDREYSRLRRRTQPAKRAPAIDDEPPMSREGTESKAIQPRAFTVIQKRAVEFVQWARVSLENLLTNFVFMRGYTYVDRDEILKCLTGETELAPEVIPPDPPDEAEDPDLIDPLDD